MPLKMVNSTLRLSRLHERHHDHRKYRRRHQSQVGTGSQLLQPGSPEELAIIGIDLLVKELGTQAAQSFIAQIFEKYPADYPGVVDSERE